MVTTSIILTRETRWLWNSSWIPLPSAPLTKMQKLDVTKKMFHLIFNLFSFLAWWIQISIHRIIAKGAVTEKRANIEYVLVAIENYSQ